MSINAAIQELVRAKWTQKYQPVRRPRNRHWSCSPLLYLAMATRVRVFLSNAFGKKRQRPDTTCASRKPALARDPLSPSVVRARRFRNLARRPRAESAAADSVCIHDPVKSSSKERKQLSSVETRSRHRGSHQPDQMAGSTTITLSFNYNRQKAHKRKADSANITLLSPRGSNRPRLFCA